MKPDDNIPAEILSAQALGRFVFRLLIIGVFASLGDQGFGKTAQGLFLLAVIYCLVVGGLRREALLAPALTHFDEAAVYGLAAGFARLAS